MNTKRASVAEQVSAEALQLACDRLAAEIRDFDIGSETDPASPAAQALYAKVRSLDALLMASVKRQAN